MDKVAYRLSQYGGILFFMFALLSVASGCATLRAERDALTRFERTQEELRSAGRGDIRPPSFAESARERKAPLEFADLNPTKLGGTFNKLIGRGPSQADAERLFKEADALHAEGSQLRDQNNLNAAKPKFVAAAKKYHAAAKRFPKSSLEQNALYMSGESFFAADYYVKANERFEKLLKEHPNSRRLDDVQKCRFAIAQYWLDLYRQNPNQTYAINLLDKSKPRNGLFGHSMRVFDRIRLDDPTGKLADDATLALANAYFAEGRFDKADEYYTDLRKTFPSSEHQFAAHFIGLKSKLMSYSGADYSGAVLDESEKLIDTLRKQFPVESEKERDYLARSRAEVRYRQAEREWTTAQYFDRKAEYGSAKFYYAIIMNDFPDTPFAQKTRERVVEIGGFPEVPEQRFEWLVDLFPREEDAKPLIATDKPKTKKR
jgi:outer membrane protein assembly factor BamD (BamD/ComL family)